MASKYRNTETDLLAQNAKYRRLAMPALRDAACEKLFKIASEAALRALDELDADEREAMEWSIAQSMPGKTLAQAIEGGLTLRSGVQVLALPVPEKPKKKKR